MSVPRRRENERGTPAKSGPSGKYIIWKDGLPYPAYADPYTKDVANAVLHTAFALPYEPVTDDEGDMLPGESNYTGMSKGEVAAIRQADAASRGSIQAAEFMFDRILGKPKQAVETLNVNMTYKDFLNTIAHQEDNTTIDVLAVTDSDPLAGL